MKPIEVNKNDEKYIKESIYTYNKTSKWRNYSNDFNSWIDKDDIIKHT